MRTIITFSSLVLIICCLSLLNFSCSKKIDLDIPRVSILISQKTDPFVYLGDTIAIKIFFYNEDVIDLATIKLKNGINDSTITINDIYESDTVRIEYALNYVGDFIITAKAFFRESYVSDEKQITVVGIPPEIGNGKRIQRSGIPMTDVPFYMYISATGTDTIKYRWYVENALVDTTGDTLKFTQLSISDTGRYYCVAYNEWGQDRSLTDSLSIIDFFEKDTIKPVIMLISPTNNTVVSDSLIPVVIQVHDNVGISLVKIDGDSVTSQDSIYTKTVILSKGTNRIPVFAQDVSIKKNVDSLTVTVLYDTVPPVLTLLSPENDSACINENSNKIEVVAKDNIGIKEVNFYVGEKQFESFALNDSVYYSTITNLVADEFTIINVEAIDKANNSDTMDVAIKYDSTVNVRVKVVWQGYDGNDNEIFFYYSDTIIQLTDNDGYDVFPQICGNNIVWEGDDGGSYDEIFYYDGSTVIQLTNNNYQDMEPQISGNNIVWQGADAGLYNEIFYYDGSTVIQLTDNNYHDRYPQIYGKNIVWHREFRLSDSEIFYYDGSTVIQLTDNNYQDEFPQIFGNNIVWSSWDGSDYDIFFYNGDTITQLTDNDYDNRSPQIYGNNIVWVGSYNNDYDIFLYNGSSIKQITSNNEYNYSYSRIYENNIVCQGSDENDCEIFFYDGTTVVQLTNNDFYNFNPQIYDNYIVWQGYDGNDFEIFLYDGSTIKQITDNNYDDYCPQISK